jgi:hypothetical protein
MLCQTLAHGQATVSGADHNCACLHSELRIQVDGTPK